eukprot:RCo029000
MQTNTSITIALSLALLTFSPASEKELVLRCSGGSLRFMFCAVALPQGRFSYLFSHQKHSTLCPFGMPPYSGERAPSAQELEFGCPNSCEPPISHSAGVGPRGCLLVVRELRFCV